METTYRIICALCIFFLRFPLYYLAPVNNLSYTDVMNNDTNLCNNTIKQFLSNSDYTKECTTLNYPHDINKLTVKYNTMETFLCLGMHDATYKVCQYVTVKKWTGTFSKKEDLDLYIQNVTGFKSNGEISSQNSIVNEKNFCEHLSRYMPMYEKVKPALMKLVESLKDPLKCNKICFDIDRKLNPLCAVLEWTNQIDQSVINITMSTSNPESKKIKVSSSTSQSTKHQEKNTVVNTDTRKEPDSIVDKIPPVEEKKDDKVIKPIEVPKIKDNNSQSENSATNSVTVNAPKGELSSVEKPHNKKNDTLTSQFTSKKTTAQADVSEVEKPPVQSQVDPVDNNKQLDSAIADEHQSPKNVEQKDDVIDNNKKSNINKSINKTTSSAMEEVKSTTLSENTQDNVIEDNVANNPNPNDFSRVDDDQLTDNLIDSLNQPMDADRNENIPDTSGQREMESIRIIKNEEESHFFTYFAITSLGFIGGYIAYHNKQKILAIVLEGRRSKNNRGRRRPSTANYRKLDCTLEEAVTSQCNANVTHVIY